MSVLSIGVYPDDHRGVDRLGLSNSDQESDVRLGMEMRNPDFAENPCPNGHCSGILDEYQIDALEQIVNTPYEHGGASGLAGAFNNCAEWSADTYSTVSGVNIDSSAGLGVDTPNSIADSTQSNAESSQPIGTPLVAGP